MASIEELREVRIEKLKKLREKGIDPYPAEVKKTHNLEEVSSSYDSLLKEKENIFLVARVRGMRKHGAITFLDIEDEFGQFQVLCSEENLGSKDYEIVSTFADIGDFIEVSGNLFKTKKDEKTLKANTFRIVVKALRPIPEEWYGLKDVEERYRKRYLDFLVNKDVKKTIENRSKLIRSIRTFLDSNGFMEVETPTLQAMAGGATARPFKTHFNIYNRDVFLRIAPELYLKRLLVGGFENIYEIAKNFRNEGVDRQHNPEFTMLEFYTAYRDYEWLMNFMEEFFRHISKNLHGSNKFKYEGDVIDLGPKFKRISFRDLLIKMAGVDWEDSIEEIKEKADELNLKYEANISKGNLADEIYKKICRPKIVQPTFVTTHPVEISPFAKRGRTPEGYTERIHLIMGRQEIINGFSELNDPLDQRERFVEQEKLRRAGDREAHEMDEDFIEALDYGMPPAAGVGVGIDRITAIFTNNHSIRDVVAFPFLKPKEND